jgi:hypothetical protein
MLSITTFSIKTLDILTLSITTLSITTLSITTLSITTLSITTLSITTLSIMILSITTLSITTLRIATLSITTLSITTLSITTLSKITFNITGKIGPHGRAYFNAILGDPLRSDILYVFRACVTEPSVVASQVGSFATGKTLLVPSEGLLMRPIRFLSDHFLIILSTFCQNDFLANFPEKNLHLEPVL